MEDENENENNNTFVKIFGSDNIVTEKSFSKDFNDEKYTTSNQFLLFSKYLDPICSFNDFNYERTNFETNPSQKNTNLFENEKLQTKEIFYNNDEFIKCYLYENLEKESNKIHFGTNIKKLYIAKKEYLFKKMFTLITEILIEKLNKKLKKVKLISEYNYDNYKICLNKKIKELLSKNEKNVKKINLLEKNKEQNFNEILNMKLNDFIFNNYETLNEKYEKFFNNKFLKYFKGAISFKKKCNSIKKLINEINNNKGNKKNKKD